MEKQILSALSTKGILMIIIIFYANHVLSQNLEMKFVPPFVIITNASDPLDTFCVQELIITTGEIPVFCQNDSLFVIGSRVHFATFTSCTLIAYSKKAPCMSIDSYTYTESNFLIWRKTRIYSSDNKIFFVFDDCERTLILLEFDLYRTSLQDARNQIISNRRRI
jgi:hypothetical protein